MEMLVKKLETSTEQAFREEVRSLRLKSDSDEISLLQVLTAFLRKFFRKLCDCFPTLLKSPKDE